MQKENSHKNKFIITGGPGFGKTSILNKLNELGFETFNEVAREIINEQRVIAGKLLPWLDRKKFDYEVIKRMTNQYHSHNFKKVAFFDRGLPDLVGWRIYDNLSFEDIEKYMNTFRYEKIVFITEEWAEIYSSSVNRPYSFEQACEINKLLARGYLSYGYVVKYLPKVDIHSRVEYIIDNIEAFSQIKLQREE